MEGLGQSPRRLDSRGIHCRGLAIDKDGAVFGQTGDLIRKTHGGYRALGPRELEQRFPTMSEIRADALRISRQLAGIARALDSGDLARAQLLGLLLPFAARSSLTKGDYNPLEPRNLYGEWITVGAVGGMLAPVFEGAGLADAVAGAALTAGRIGIGATGVAIGGAATGMLYPSGNWRTYQGTLPGHSDIDYRYDEGYLALYRAGADGKSEILFEGSPDRDGLYRDAAGNVVGRNLGGPFQVDASLVAVGRSEEARAFIAAHAAVATDEPQVCPDPTFDWPHAASYRAVAYQAQITGLPPGVGVGLNGVIYDGCSELTGNMLDAKGPGYERFMRYGFWSSIVAGLDKLAKRQSAAAGGRIVEWHFAEQAPADWMRRHFDELGLTNILVVYTPAT